MKKPKAILLMLILSSLSLLYRVYEVFIRKIERTQLLPTNDSSINRILEESQSFSYQNILFQQNMLNKLLIIILLFLILLSLFFYIKNQFVVSHILYIFYILIAFIQAIYKFYGTRSLILDLTISDAIEFAFTSIKFSIIISIYLSFIYFAITLYSLIKLKRKPLYESESNG